MQKQNGGFHDFAPSWMKAPDKNGKMVCWLYSNELYFIIINLFISVITLDMG